MLMCTHSHVPFPTYVSANICNELPIPLQRECVNYKPRQPSPESTRQNSTHQHCRFTQKPRIAGSTGRGGGASRWPGSRLSSCTGEAERQEDHERQPELHYEDLVRKKNKTKNFFTKQCLPLPPLLWLSPVISLYLPLWPRLCPQCPIAVQISEPFPMLFPLLEQPSSAPSSPNSSLPISREETRWLLLLGLRQPELSPENPLRM